MFRILALDGGGIKGTFSAAVLDQFEEQLGGSLVDYFNLIVGTSTGGIIALGLACGIEARRVLSLYKDEGHKMFPPATRLHELCGAGRRLGRDHRRSDGRAGRRRSCSPSTPTCPASFQPTLMERPFPGQPAPSGLSADEKLAYDRLQFVYQKGIAYGFQMGLRPQTLYGIADSPVGLAAYFLDHDARSYELIARVFDGKTEGLTRDDILDNITITWLTNTAISGARLYWEYFGKGYFNAKGVSIPVAVSVFPDELYPAPRSWTEQAYPKLIHYNRLPKGGHFAAWEQPQLFSEEVRAGFRSLRS